MNKLATKRKIMGLGIILSGMFVALIFHVFLVVPAFTVLENGRYGEMFAPVSYFRIPAYIMLGIIMSVGVLLMFLKNQIVVVASYVGIALLILFGFILFLICV